jgi:molybdopterin/thiamine biosynthesis adenylyltransferase
VTLPRFFDSVFWSIRFQRDAALDEDGVRRAAAACVPQIIALGGADRQSGCAEGMRTFVNLAARTFAAISLDVEPALRGELVKLARAINPRIDLAPRTSTARVTWGEGGPAYPSALWVGGRDWTASVSRAASVPSTPNRAAGAVAGILAYGELFKIAFAEFLGGEWEPIDTAHLSLLTYRVAANAEADGVGWPTAVSLGNAHLVGLGAVGMAALAAVRMFRGLSGHLTLIDNQRVDLSNLQRYLLAFDADATSKLHKVDVAHREMKRTGLVISGKASTWERYLADLRNQQWRFERVVTALDSAFARQLVQASLPREILNGGITRSVLDVGRYGFDGVRECLNCAYQHAPPPPALELMRQTFGLSPARLQQLEDDNSGLNLTDVRVIESHVGRPGQLAFLIGQSVRSAYLRMCGFAALPRRTLAENEPALVPAAHIPALCGMLLGIELVKGSVAELTPFRLDHLFQFDARYGLNPAFQLTALQLLDGPCVCQDPRYQAAYRAKWPAT